MEFFVMRLNPYEPPEPNDTDDEPSVLFKSAVCCVAGLFLWLLIWTFVPVTPFWFPIRLGLTMFAWIPLIMGLVYGTANLLLGQEEF